MMNGVVGTVLRLVDAGLDKAHLAAIFVTHVHSDHVVDLADVAMTRWVLQQLVTTGPLEIVVPRGAPERFVERMLEPFAEDLALRMVHVQPQPPEIRVNSFDLPSNPTLVWTSADGSVTVDAVGWFHRPGRRGPRSHELRGRCTGSTWLTYRPGRSMNSSI